MNRYRPTALRARLDRALHRIRHDEEGAETAEYAMVIMAAVALAGVLIAVVQSGAVSGIIEDLVVSAFQR
ncbi:DUF4244 domain-containing protein [Gulosibacter sp. 10]|uniref:DUF4244 domain-containing protein n=1 Tax=Gulosibacter sp. 10 TaxID=1255570 RepID=UPI00097F29C9|nr:DUF4244 domain-containing protein [Gulosibacter sp. 10]SJM69382.1 hypothetical protein FM112_14120 [Gulosibacter sp. 10]